MRDKKPSSVFICPTCGQIENDDVAVMCNTCQLQEASLIDGIYVCPQCETAVHPFTCRICDSDLSWQTPLESISSQES